MSTTPVPIPGSSAAMAASTPDDTEPPQKPRLLPLSAVLDEFDKTARAGYEAKRAGLLLGPSTGFPSLDGEIGGSLQPGLHIAHGVPGIGKTAFALQLASNCGCPALFVTCEMAPVELLRRIASRATKTPLHQFKTFAITPDEAAQRVRRAINETPHVALLDATSAPTPRADVEDAAETIRQSAPENPHLLIVVDSLHSWTEGWGKDYGTEYERLNAGLAALRQMAASLKCPVLAIAERNRQSMKGGGMSAGAGTRKIEYGSETVFDLSWDRENGNDPWEAPPPDANGEVPVVVTLSKNRHGSPGVMVPLRFHGGFQRYREAAT